MLEAFVLGLVQGVVEWLPVSSEGAIVLTRLYVFDGSASLHESIELALFLHFGTFLSALVYFRDDVLELLRGALRYRRTSRSLRRTLLFLIVATLVSGLLGFGLLELIESMEAQLRLTGKGITVLVGILLLVTGFTQLRAGGGGELDAEDLGTFDGLLLGLAQGVAALPGISRSGMTISALLLRNYREEQALRLSFLLSLPIVLGANVVLNYERFVLTMPSLAGLLASFVAGLLTIHGLLAFARRIRFGYFVLVFGIVTILAGFV